MRRFVVGMVAGVAALDAAAQGSPAKPVHLLIGFPPGTAGDVLARIVRPRLAEMLGQPVIVENRAGASLSLSIERVATAPADGHTLLIQTSSSTALPALHAKLPYDLQRDLAPVSLLAVGPYLLVVHPSVPARSARATRQIELRLVRRWQRAISGR